MSVFLSFLIQTDLNIYIHGSCDFENDLNFYEEKKNHTIEASLWWTTSSLE